MSDPISEDRPASRSPAPPSGKSIAAVRLVFALLGLAAFAGVWAITGTLGVGWRIALAVLVASPLLLVPDLLRGERGPKRND